MDNAADDTWSYVKERITEAAFQKAVQLDPGPYVAFWDAQGVCRVASAHRENLHLSVPRLNSWYINYTLPLTL